jgi:hypothetical protein
MWQCYLSSIFRVIRKGSHSEYGDKKPDEKRVKNAMNHEQLIEKNRQYYYYGATITQIIKIFKVTFDKAVFKGTVSRAGFGF